MVMMISVRRSSEISNCRFDGQTVDATKGRASVDRLACDGVVTFCAHILKIGPVQQKSSE